METLKVVGFADASFANNHDLSTQLGHIVFLCDAKGNAAPIAFRSYKSRRVVRSAMAGEVIAFSDMFDVAVTLAEEIRAIYDRPIPLHLLMPAKVSVIESFRTLASFAALITLQMASLNRCSKPPSKAS